MGIKHFYQPTPAKWRKIGDTISLSCISLSGMVLGTPLTDVQQKWVILALSMLGVAGKAITNFFKEDSEPVEADSPK